MRIFLDIGHPAHVHYFKNFVVEMQSRGHEFLISARDKEMTHYLLNKLSFPYIDRGKGSDSMVGKLAYLARANAQLLPHARRFKPDLFLSFGSPYAAHNAALLRRPHIAFDDTENAKLGQLFYRPFTKTVLSPDTFAPSFGQKHLKFPGYMELCHLHPNYFTPDEACLRDAGINPNEDYTVLRFVSWNANHDIGHQGLSNASKIAATQAFLRFGNVYITSEAPLPEELEPYRASFHPELVHHVLAFARLCYGESATMSSEAAVLGTPAIYIDDEGRGYTTEQEKKYGLVHNFSESHEDQLLSIQKGVEVLAQDRSVFQKRRKQMLTDKIDMTAFMVWFIENFPESVDRFQDRIGSFAAVSA